MPALDFPDSPAVGDLYGSSGVVWRWDGTVWASTAGIAGVRGVVAWAQIVASVTGIAATFANVLAATVTLKAGRTYKITAEMQAYSSVGTDTGEMAIQSGGASLQTTPVTFQGVNNQSKLHGEFVYAPSADVTLALQVNYRRTVGSGTHTAYAATTFPAFLLVEDITYDAGAPGGNGGWVQFTPTWTNFTPGNATVTMYKRYTTKNLEIFGQVVLGSTSVVAAGAVELILPDGVQAIGGQFMPVGDVHCVAGAVYTGAGRVSTGFTSVILYTNLISGTAVVLQTVTSTLPFAWATGNTIRINFSVPIA